MAITSGVTVSRLSAEETREHGFTHAAVIPYSSVVTVGGATTTATIAIADVIAGDVVAEAAYKLTTSFTDSDASLNSVTIQVGDGSNTARFLAAASSQLSADGSTLTYGIGAAGVAATPTCPYVYASADTVDVLFTVAGGASPTCAELTAGSVTVYLRINQLSKL